MAAYTELRSALYNIVSRMFPDTEVIHMYGGVPEPYSPYIGIHILGWDQVGREEISSYANELIYENPVGGEAPEIYTISVKVTYEVMVQISCRGSTAGDLAHEFNQKLNNPLVWEIMQENNLSKMRVSNIRPAPQLRETQWIQGFNQDVTFAYCYVTDQEIDVIEQVKIISNPNSPDEIKFTVTSNTGDIKSQNI